MPGIPSSQFDYLVDLDPFVEIIHIDPMREKHHILSSRLYHVSSRYAASGPELSITLDGKYIFTAQSASTGIKVTSIGLELLLKEIAIMPEHWWAGKIGDPVVDDTVHQIPIRNLSHMEVAHMYSAAMWLGLRDPFRLDLLREYLISYFEGDSELHVHRAINILVLSTEDKVDDELREIGCARLAEVTLAEDGWEGWKWNEKLLDFKHHWGMIEELKKRPGGAVLADLYERIYKWDWSTLMMKKQGRFDEDQREAKYKYSKELKVLEEGYFGYGIR